MKKIKGINLLLIVMTLSLPPSSPQALQGVRLLGECLVPCEEIVSGGPGKDGIPSIDKPKFVLPEKSTSDLQERVAGIVVDGKPYALPYNILNWHEIVNFQDGKTTFSYCPLTGSAIAFDRDKINGETFGVSGMLYQNNLVMYDRGTDSYFSQMLRIGITGERINIPVNQIQVTETTLETWIKLHPDTVVLSEETGYNRDYQRYPYGSYKTDRSIYFPSSFNPEMSPFNLHHPKTRTLIAILDETTILLPYPELEKEGGFLNIKFNGTQYVVMFDESADIARIFESYQEVTLVKKDNQEALPTFTDTRSRVWSLDGKLLSGTGQSLKQIQTSFTAFWFAASVFYRDSLIFENGSFVKDDSATPLINPSVTFTGKINKRDLDAPFYILVTLTSLVVIALVLKKRNIWRTN